MHLFEQATLVFFGLTSLITLFFLCYTIHHSIRLRKVSGIATVTAFVLIIGFCLVNKEACHNIYFVLNVIQAILLAYIIIYFIISVFCFNRTEYEKSEMPQPAVLPTVTILIAVKDECEVIGKTIENLLNLQYDKSLLTITIIDDDSTDSTVECVSEYSPRINLITRINPIIKGKPAAINEVMPHVDSDLVCLFDADSLPASNFLLQAIKHFEDPQVALVQGRNIEYNDTSTIVSRLVAYDGDVTHMSMYYPKSIVGLPMFEGRAGMFKRSAFNAVEGFDLSLPFEDWDFGYRLQLAGFKLAYDPSLKNYEQAPETFADHVKQRYRWMSNGPITFAKIGKSIFTCPHFSFAQKCDTMFVGIYNLWSLIFNPIGMISLLGYILNYGLPSNTFAFMFISMTSIYVSASIINTRKYIYILYIPLMYLYYWLMSIIVTWIFVDHYSICIKPKYKKANHYALPLQKHKVVNN